jgi:hypothetical protein
MPRCYRCRRDGDFGAGRGLREEKVNEWGGFLSVTVDVVAIIVQEAQAGLELFHSGRRSKVSEVIHFPPLWSPSMGINVPAEDGEGSPAIDAFLGLELDVVGVEGIPACAEGLKHGVKVWGRRDQVINVRAGVPPEWGEHAYHQLAEEVRACLEALREAAE